MNLLGVTPITSVRVDGAGRSFYKFKFRGVSLTPRTYKQYLKKSKLSPEQMILELNHLSKTDLPICVVCKSNHVLIGTTKHINILEPVVAEYCGSTCASRLRNKNVSKSSYKNGTNSLLNLSESDISSRARKIINASLRNGTHPIYSTSRKDAPELDLDGRSFRSNGEQKFYKRFTRLLDKYYVPEQFAGEYWFNGSDHVYVADYVLKPEYSSSTLPGVIEIKSGSMYEFRGVDVSRINYLKFKSVIDSGRFILVADGSKMHRLKSISDLDSLFKDKVTNV